MRRALTLLAHAVLPLLLLAPGTPARAGALRAGASAVDITPTVFPVIQNGGFLEGKIQLATEKLHARCLALDDGDTRLALLVVDSCMIPRTLCDEAKALAAGSTGLAKDRILISATHTHSAPSVMDFCLGSRADPQYTAFLLPKLVEAIALAVARLEPAEAAWASLDAGEYTNCRRWITRADQMQVDPFGERSVRAMMHPGYQNLNFVGPAGPKNPWLSFLNVRTVGGQPLAVLGNFSMHYFSGHAGASADYFGHFNRQIADLLAPGDDRFVGILSQGTSGDLWWADYGKPKIERQIAEYAGALARLVATACKEAHYQSDLPVAMAETRMTLGRRVPDAARLAWARGMLKEMDGRRPRNRPEVYAEQAVYIEENPSEEIVLQAIRVGELGIAAMPNEVYGITGLKVAYGSPFATSFTIELANGAAGYIPPPEQHALGGYNTWPARTAGLEVEAEPKIVEAVLSLLERVSQRPRRVYAEPASEYSKRILASQPLLYWRLGELAGPAILDAGPHGIAGRYAGQVAYHLPGIENDAATDSRCVHLVDGHLAGATDRLGDRYTVLLQMWDGIVGDREAMPVRLMEMGDWVLGIAGQGENAGRFFVERGGEERQYGRTPLASRQWQAVALVCDGKQVRVFLGGPNQGAEIDHTFSASPAPPTTTIALGRGLQGKLDEVVVYDRALAVGELGDLLR